MNKQPHEAKPHVGAARPQSPTAAPEQKSTETHGKAKPNKPGEPFPELGDGDHGGVSQS